MIPSSGHSASSARRWGWIERAAALFVWLLPAACPPGCEWGACFVALLLARAVLR